MNDASTDARPLRLDCLGLNERMQQRFELVFKDAGKEIASIVNNTVAEAVLVDLDNPAGKRDLPRYRKAFPQRPVIALSVKPLELPAPDLCLGKPIEIGALLRAAQAIRRHLDQLATREDAAAVDVMEVSAGTQARTIVLDDNADDPELFQQTVTLNESPLSDHDVHPLAADRSQPASMDISGCLLDKTRQWRESLRERTTPGLLRWQQLWFLYEAQSERVVCSLSRGELEEICLLPCDGVDMRQGDAPLELAEQAISQQQELGCGWADPDGMLWDLALWTYGEQIPSGTQLNERLYLAHWPNLTRLTLIPNAMRIAALWVEQPLSLRSLAEALRIPLVDVTRFYCACHSIGIAGPARRSADTLFRTAPVQATADRPLFGRLLGRLRGLLHAGDHPEAPA